MAELNFPNNPYLGQEYDFGNFIYSWDGVKWTTVSSGGNPAQDLRVELASNQGAEMIGTASGSTVQAELDKAGTGASLESLRRSYADAGFFLDVNESFELGGTIESNTEILVGPGLVGYSWGGTLPKVVPPGSTPESAGGIGGGAWIDQSNNILRDQAKAYIDAADAALQVNIDGKSPVGHTHTPQQAGAAPVVHSHTIADVSGLQGALDGKSPNGHSHTMANITDLQPALDAKAPVVHGHSIADVSNLQSTLDSKSPVGHTHVMSDITDLQPALDGKAPAVHSHGEYILRTGDTMSGNLSAPDFYVTSDARLKSNLVPLEGALAKVLAICGYEYDKTMTVGPRIKHEAGVIAQDVEAVFPVAVTKEGTQGIRTVSQSAMIALLVEAVKELKAQVDTLSRPARVAPARLTPAPAPTPKVEEVKL